MNRTRGIHRCSLFFFFNATSTTEIYTLSLHDALPIYAVEALGQHVHQETPDELVRVKPHRLPPIRRSEEHTSELQSHHDLVCRLLLEKKNEDVTARAEQAKTVVEADVDRRGLDDLRGE